MNTKLTESIFTIDFLDGITFKGFSLNEDWNGWACPYFTFEESKRIVEEWRKRGLKALYVEEKDTFIFEVEAVTGENFDTFSPSEIEGEKLYPIGNSTWIWEEK